MRNAEKQTTCKGVITLTPDHLPETGDRHEQLCYSIISYPDNNLNINWHILIPIMSLEVASLESTSTNKDAILE